MRTLLNSPEQPAVQEFEERKSVFIGAACHINNEAEALSFVQKRRAADPKARHICYCAIWGDDSLATSINNSGTLSERISDDGEPSGTAGKPILEVLRRNDMTNCIVTVTRYFGGILLGAGGLIRAYSTAASLVIQTAQQAQIISARSMQVTVDYARYERFKQLVEHLQGTVENVDFTDRVSLTINLPSHQQELFNTNLTNEFKGQIVAQDLGEVYSYQPL